MKRALFGAVSSVLLLTACGGGNEIQSIETPADPAALVFSYPADAQRNVSPVADVVLRFSESVDLDSVADNVVVRQADSQLPFTVESVDGGRSVVLRFSESLAQGADFEVVFERPVITTSGAEIANPVRGNNDQAGIQFSTRAGLTGIAGLDSTSERFSIRSVVPANGTPFEPSDLAAFRLELSQAVDPAWREKGGSIRLIDEDGADVPVNVLINNRLITVDPCTTSSERGCGSPDDQLVGGQAYTLEINNLASLSGQRLNQSQTFRVRETEPTAVQFQNATDPGITEGGPVIKSRLNDQAVNGIVLNSVLQGTTDQSESLGSLFTELAFAPTFEADEALPLRIPRGSRLLGSSLPVRVNGTVPIIDEETQALQRTGDINVVMVSDATGYLLPNPYTDNQAAPKHVRLFMDVAMNTERPQPNASLSQNLLHVELVGIALVEDGILTIDALSIVEPNLLGQEVTDATVAFQIQADTDVDVQFEAIQQRLEDTQGPQLVSWQPGPDAVFPGDRDQIQRPGDPVSLFYDEPLLPASAEQGITVFEGGVEVPARVQVDGTAVTVNPLGGLKHGVPYTIAVGGELTDVAGNSAVSQSLEFELPDLGGNSVARVSPLPLTTYPGYPCVTTGVNLQADNHGQCLDDAPGGPLGDVLPITRIPSDRPIVVVFSNSIDLSTVRLGETFTVERLNESGSAAETVAGRLELSHQRIRFFPDEPWQPGAAYRYTLRSNTVGDCTAAICSEDGLPIQTDLLVDPSDVGGPDLEIAFRGKDPIRAVYTPLRNLPVRDVNSNYEVDCGSLGSTECLEPFDHEADPLNAGEFLPSENAAKLVVRENENASALGIPLRANVGCSPGESCPRNKFIYQTFALNTEVVGPVDPSDPESGVRVLLYPTQLAATSLSVFLDVFGEQATGPTILRMRYEPRTEDNPEGLIPGRIFEGPDGGTRFETVVQLYLDGPNLSLPAAQLLEHDLYSKEITLKLEGPIRFFDDGRMQVTLLSVEAIPLDVNVDIVLPLVGDVPVLGDLLNLVTDDLLTEVGNVVDGLLCLLDPNCDEPRQAEGTVNIPLEIPAGGINLNFVSFPIKQLPVETNGR